MTKVDFYTGSSDKLRTACQLSHKAMQNGLHTVISLPDATSCETLDRLLWTYPDTAFIPHCRMEDSSKPEQSSSHDSVQEKCPVILSYSNGPFPHHDLLINLNDDQVSFFSRFDRVIEIVGTDQSDSRRGRERYKFYRDRGYELRHFDLSGTNQP